MSEHIDKELEMEVIEIDEEYKTLRSDINPVIDDQVSTDVNISKTDNSVSDNLNFAETFNSIGDGVIITDLDFVITSLNKSAQLLTGWNEEDVIGKKIEECFEIINNKKNNRKNIELNSKVEDIDQYDDCLFVSKNSVKNSFRVSTSPLQNDLGKTTNTLLILKSEDQSKNISSNNFYKYKHDNFVTITRGLIHDINNYFTPLLANLSLLKFNTDKDDENYDRISTCEMSCIKAIDFMQKLSFLCETSKLKKELATISDVINSSIDLILSGTKIKCDYRIQENLKPVEVDKNKIVQALYNIVKIYREGMKDGGTINVTVENFQKEQNEFLPIEDKDYIRITIEDDGDGINLDEIEFKTDYDFDSKENTNALGLTMAFNIIKEHDGFFDIDSISSQSTKVYLYLPTLDEEVLFLDKDSQELVASDEIPGNDTRKLNILVMDDNDSVSGSLADMLLKLNSIVHIAKDGEEALKLYSEACGKNENFDVAILDLTVPGGMGAEEIVKSLKAINTDVKLVVTSGTADHPVMQNFKNHGFDSFILKPFDFAEIRSVIDGLVN